MSTLNGENVQDDILKAQIASLMQENSGLRESLRKMEKLVAERTSQMENTNRRHEKAIANATLLAREAEEALQESKKIETEIVHINKVLQVINSSLNLDAIMKAVSDALREIFEFNQIGIQLIDESRQMLKFSKGVGEFNKQQLRQISKIEFSLNERESMFVRTVKQNRRTYISDITQEMIAKMYPKDRQAYLTNPVKGILFLPLRVQNRVIGSLTIGNSSDSFNLAKKTQRKIQRYVNHIAIAINNARMVEETRRSLAETKKKEREIAHLNQVVQAVNSTLDLDKIMRSVLIALQDNFRFDQIGIFLADEKNENLVPIKYYGTDVSRDGFLRLKKIPFPLRRKVSYVCETFLLKKTHYFSPITPKLVKYFMPTDKILFEENPVKSYLLYPLQVQQNVIGTIVFASVHEEFDLSAAQIETIQQYVSQIANAIHNASLYNDLEQARHVAEAATKSKSQFLANMSHEIRTPMNAIIGLIGLALKHELSPKLTDYLKKIESSAHTLLGIINDILDFSKIEAGKMTMEALTFQLENVLENVSNLIGIKCEEKKIKLNFHIDETIPKILIGDPLRLSQVLINLANNAVKFTETGEIAIHILFENEKEESTDTVSLKFMVCDTGIGMTHQQIGQLFKSFSQADKSISRRFGGSGLGLAISKYIVEMMGGYIWVDSEYGKGSIFSFTAKFKIGEKLPRDQTETFSDDCVVGRQCLKETLVLLVEDNEINQLVASELLAAEGASVKIAANGREAVEIIKDSLGGQKTSAMRRFDAVLMDVRMPVMDGYEATRAIRELEDQVARDGNRLSIQDPHFKMKNSTKKLPIIAMTAHALIGEREKCLSVGMNDFITKPIYPQTLYQTLIKWIAPHQKTSSGGKSLSESFSTKQILPETLKGLDTHIGLHNVANNLDTYQTILSKFVGKYKHIDSEIKTAILKDDVPAAIFKVHSIKSVIGNIGALHLYQITTDLERALMEEDWTGCRDLLKKFSMEMTVVLNSIEQIFSKVRNNQEDKEKPIGRSGEKKSPIDFSIVKALLLKMSRLLGVDLIETKSCMNELKHILGKSEELIDFEDAMDEYDFDRAVEKIEQIAQKYKIELS